MDGRLLQRAGLVYLAFSGFFVGIWATFAPRSFYDDFPGLGRVWVSVDGPWNEHLVRDVGQLSLALGVVTLAAAVSMQRQLVLTAASAGLLNAVPHLVYHVRHLEKYSTADQLANVVSLGLLAAIPALVLVLALRRSESPGRASTPDPNDEHPATDARRAR